MDEGAEKKTKKCPMCAEEIHGMKRHAILAGNVYQFIYQLPEVCEMRSHCRVGDDPVDYTVAFRWATVPKREYTSTCV